MQEIPLADRMRPRSLKDYIGQSRLVGPKGLIRKMLQADFLPSMILYGPPGAGKTTLARLLSETIKRPFYQLSAVSSGLKEVREFIERSKARNLFSNNTPILFIDEIHRFNKPQQESLLEALEKGYLKLIGTTTENPSFELSPALLSRCQVYTLFPLTPDELKDLALRAIEKDPWLSKKKVHFKQYSALISYSGGDGRKLLNAIEIIVGMFFGESIIHIDDAIVQKSLARKFLGYDKSGNEHYNMISAFIKSVRASKVDAALYWLARMIEGGEKLTFIARRMLILASEDIGNADPMALVLANSTFQAVSIVGYPEGRILLSQCSIYLSQAPKSDVAYKAINSAQEYVRSTGDLPVPLHLRNSPIVFTRKSGYNKYDSLSCESEHESALINYFPKGVKKVFFSEGIK